MREMSAEKSEKSKDFAKKVIELAVEEGLTVIEFKGAIDFAEAISEESAVEMDAIKRSEYFL